MNSSSDVFFWLNIKAFFQSTLRQALGFFKIITKTNINHILIQRREYLGFFKIKTKTNINYILIQRRDIIPYRTLGNNTKHFILGV